MLGGCCLGLGAQWGPAPAARTGMGVTRQGVAAGSGMGLAGWGTVVGIGMGVAAPHNLTAAAAFGTGTAAGLEFGLVCWGSAPWISSAGVGMTRWGAAVGTWTVMEAAWWPVAHLGPIKVVGMGRAGQGVPAGTETGTTPPGWTATAGNGRGVARRGVAPGTGIGAARWGTAPWGPMTAGGTGMVRWGAAPLGLLRVVGPSVEASRWGTVAETGAAAACQGAAPRGPMALAGTWGGAAL